MPTHYIDNLLLASVKKISLMKAFQNYWIVGFLVAALVACELLVSVSLVSDQLPLGSTGIDGDLSALGSPHSPQLWWSNHSWWDEDLLNSIARPWTPIQDFSWCVPQGENKAKVHGLVFVKLPKAASSTGSGIAINIARSVGKRVLKNEGNKPKCGHTYQHGFGFRRRESPSILWTILRDPSSRALSEYFHFQVSRLGVAPTSEGMIRFLRTRQSYQLNYIYSANKKSIAVDTPAKVIRHYVMEEYNFVALVERLDESLVVMKLLWGLEDQDIIVLPAKHSGGYDDGRFQKKCTKIRPAFTTPQVDEYLRTNFTKLNSDYLLYAAANRSLDMTIEKLGRERVAAQVQKHRWLQRAAEEKCLSQAIFPCSANGIWQGQESMHHCYWGDSGCGHRCVNEMFQPKDSWLSKWRNGV
jgi:hypothetical protein